MVEELLSLRDAEREHIFRVLQAVGGNKARCARVLGVDRRTLYRKLAQYGIGTDVLVTQSGTDKERTGNAVP